MVWRKSFLVDIKCFFTIRKHFRVFTYPVIHATDVLVRTNGPFKKRKVDDYFLNYFALQLQPSIEFELVPFESVFVNALIHIQLLMFS
jgi:hypothetical protein